MRARSPTPAALLLVAACGSSPESLPPEGHLVVHLDTDAPLPPAPGIEPAPNAPYGLFDRIVIDVYEPGAPTPCKACTREFDLDEELFLHGASFTVLPDRSRTGLRARVRMFALRSTLDGAIPEDASLEAVVALPDVPLEGSEDVFVYLPTERVGRPIGTLLQPVLPARGAPQGSLVGTWPLAEVRDCEGSPGKDEVCVPGGAYWMGSASHYDSSETHATAQRLVVVSPFYVTDHEATVAEARASGVLGTQDVAPWSGLMTGDVRDFCTYTIDPDPEQDPKPVTCVSWEGARKYCESLGATLLTEAQFEYLAGARRSQPHVWGVDEPRCDDAVWGMGQNLMIAAPCAHRLDPSSIGGPIALTSKSAGDLGPPRERDVLVLPGGPVFDLAGNLTEWVVDDFQRQSEPCWNRPESNVFVDPVCTTPGVDGELKTIKGSNWSSTARQLRAAQREHAVPFLVGIDLGIRCARPG